MDENVNKSIESFPQRDIERIGAEVERLKRTPEFEGAKTRVVVKESIKQAFPALSTSSTTVAVTDHDEDQLLPDYMKTDSKEDKDEVEGLLHIALTEGIEVSIKEARKRRARILDDLHDALTDKVMPQLEKQGHLE